MKVRNPVLILLKSAFFELLIGVALAILVLFSYYFLSANTAVFTDFSILAHSAGAARFWLSLYLGSDAGFLVVFALFLLEIALLCLRGFARVGAKAYEEWSGKDTAKAVAFLKKISLLYVFRILGVNTRTKAVIVYASVIALLLVPGWIAKAVLKSQEDLVYRSHADYVHLESEDNALDFTAAIEADTTYDLVISANVGMVHLYTGDDDSFGHVYFLYDTESQKEAFSLSNDAENGVLTISFGPETDYERYVDPVLSSVEIFLPSNLPIGSVSVTIGAEGFLTVQYLDFASFSADVRGTDVSFIAQESEVGTIDLDCTGGNLDFAVGTADSLRLELDGTQARGTATTLKGNLDARLLGGAYLYLYRTASAALAVDAADSSLELREVYAPAFDIAAAGGKVFIANSQKDYAYTAFVLEATDGCAVDAQGVPYDPQGNG